MARVSAVLRVGVASVSALGCLRLKLRLRCGVECGSLNVCPANCGVGEARRTQPRSQSGSELGVGQHRSGLEAIRGRCDGNNHSSCSVQDGLTLNIPPPCALCPHPALPVETALALFLAQAGSLAFPRKLFLCNFKSGKRLHFLFRLNTQEPLFAKM